MMKTILITGVCVAALVGAAVLHRPHAQPASVNIEDRRKLWNGYWGDPAKGEDVFDGGEVQAWVHPFSTRTIPPDEVDPYPGTGAVNEPRQLRHFKWTDRPPKPPK